MEVIMQSNQFWTTMQGFRSFSVLFFLLSLLLLGVFLGDTSIEHL